MTAIIAPVGNAKWKDEQRPVRNGVRGQRNGTFRYHVHRIFGERNALRRAFSRVPDRHGDQDADERDDSDAQDSYPITHGTSLIQVDNVLNNARLGGIVPRESAGRPDWAR